MCLLIGWKEFLLVQLPILFIAGALGIWLFYVQHQFEDSYFEENDEWEYVKAAVEGSSYYKLPKVFQWITGNFILIFMKIALYYIFSGKSRTLTERS